MERQRLSIAETEKINQSLQIKMEELDRVISQAGRAVSSFVNYPAYVATAGKGSVTASRFELLPVDEKSCIVVMMMGDNRVKSQLLRMQLKVDRDQMAALVELLNRHFTGISIKEMNQKLMAISQGITPQLFLLLSQTVNYAVDVLEESNHREFIMAGTNQLLKLPEFRDADKAHELMSFLADDKEKLPVPDEGPIKILIGPENVNDALKDTSVVVASYDIGDDMRGLIGVVGPTRMDYATVAARLTGFADGLTRLFGKPRKNKNYPRRRIQIHERRNQRAFRGDSRDRGNGGDGAGKDSGESGAGKEGQEERKEGKGHHLYPGAGGEDGTGCQAAGIREGSVHPPHCRV